MQLLLCKASDDLNNMEILIYRHDEEESTASVFSDVRQAIDHMKQRAESEWKEWPDYIIKPNDSQ